MKDPFCQESSGTTSYMAPEIFEVGHWHGVSSEAFSFGILMYELATGERPLPSDMWTRNWKSLTDQGKEFEKLMKVIIVLFFFSLFFLN